MSAPGGERLADVAAESDSAVGDHRDPVLVGLAGALLDGGDLGHPRAGHDPGGADRSRTDPDLDGIDTERDEIPDTGRGGDVADDERRVGKVPLDPLDGVEHTARVGVRAVETEHIDLAFDERGAAIVEIAGDADGGRHPQATEVVLAGVGIVVRLLDVLDGDETLEAPVVRRR